MKTIDTKNKTFLQLVIITTVLGFMPLVYSQTTQSSRTLQDQTIVLDATTGSITVEFINPNVGIDFSKFAFMGISVENKTDTKLIIDVQYNGSNKNHANQGRFFVDKKEFKENKLILNRASLDKNSDWYPMFKDLRALPGNYVNHWTAFDFNNMKKVIVTVSWENHNPSTSNEVIIKKPYGLVSYVLQPLSQQPTPLLDDLGQYTFDQWEGKLHSKSDLEALGNKDYSSYKNENFSGKLSQYGGWKEGPKMEAKGYFYTKKYNNKWWFVDPEGYLFWSSGVTGAGVGSSTPTINKEYYFPTFAEEKANPDWQLLKSSIKNGTTNFYELNIKRKYGEDWESKHGIVTSGRLKNWGINTFGAWSNTFTDIKHPYTLIVHPIKEGIGSIKKMIDPFSEIFINNLKSQLALLEKYEKDPYLLGVFIDNELHWGTETKISYEVLNLNNTVAARLAMEIFLKNKYSTIAKLNSSWDSQFSSFEDINGSKTGNFSAIFKNDMLSYFNYFADTYFKITATELHKILPNHLYLGCRFHDSAKFSEVLQKAASRHCDVLSFNIYEYSVKQFKVFLEVDKPSIIGEFHFGTGTHGVWGTGIRSASDVKNQAQLYQQYMNEALANPNFIGAHWFQWSDQPATGRGDGENFRIGMVNVTDQPYPEFIKTIKETTNSLYETRNK